MLDQPTVAARRRGIVTSVARRVFEANCKDVRDFYSIHQLSKGQRAVLRKLPVLNKAMVVLITAMWEAYCEDLTPEALHLMVVNSSRPDQLPIYLRKVIAREVRDEKHELAPWFLAGEGWRELLVRRLASLQQDRDRNLNNLTSKQVDRFFLEALGIQEISQGWSWQGMEAVETARQLDEFVNLRHQIAHRARLAKDTPKKTPKSYINLFRNLVACTENSVEQLLIGSIGQSPWRSLAAGAEDAGNDLASLGTSPA
jgi:hypothetical protein